MDHQALHSKVIECSKSNKKMLTNIMEHVSHKKREMKQLQMNRFSDYRREYEELLKLNKQSEEENFRLKKEIALIDIEIQQLSLRNTLSLSRLKIQNGQIQNIKDQTYDMDRKKKKQGQVVKSNQQLKDQIERLQEQVKQKQTNIQKKKNSIVQIQQENQQIKHKKQQTDKIHKDLYKRHLSKIDSLQNQLRLLKIQATQLRILRERQEEKTKRNNKVEALNQIKGLLRKHKQTYQN